MKFILLSTVVLTEVLNCNPIPTIPNKGGADAPNGSHTTDTASPTSGESDSDVPVRPIETDAAEPQTSDSGARDRNANCPYPGQIAVAELCNGFDDNCDGVVDEGVCDDLCDAKW